MSSSHARKHRSEVTSLRKRALEMESSSAEMPLFKRRRVMVLVNDMRRRADVIERSVENMVSATSGVSESTRDVMMDSLAKGTIRYTNPDHCSACGVDMILIQSQSMVRCPSCHVTRVDYQNPATNFGDLEQRSVGVTGMVASKSSGGDSTLFRRHLNQFRDDVEDPPEDVLRRIIDYHDACIYSMSGERVRRNITMEALAGPRYSKYANMTVRLPMLLLGFPVPRMNAELIQRLVRRFEVFRPFFETVHDRKAKNPNYVAMTKRFLELEGRKDLADMMFYHKSNTAYVSEMSEIDSICRRLVQVSDLKWVE